MPVKCKDGGKRQNGDAGHDLRRMECLPDERALAVGILGHRVEFGNGVIKSPVGNSTGKIRQFQDFVLKDGEVECQTEAQWVSWSQLDLSKIRGLERKSVLAIRRPELICTWFSGVRIYLVRLEGRRDSDVVLLA